MRYVGGKSRLARSLAEIIVPFAAERAIYLEPFLGGGSVFARVAPHYLIAHGSDIVPDLMLMWQAARDGWVPPNVVTDEMYAEMRHAEPSPLRGFVGFGCSFGGKWFGGRAKGGGRNHADESARAVTRVAHGMKGAILECRPYDSHTVTPEHVVYCDPPYAGTTGYAAAGEFDSALFWKTTEQWASDGALVFVSEYSAPSDWHLVWEGQHRQSLQHGAQGRPPTVERLFCAVDISKGVKV